MELAVWLLLAVRGTGALSIPGPGKAAAGSGWSLSSLDSDRAFLHTAAPMSWAEAEDYCQTVYGHLATDDSAGELRQFIAAQRLGGAVWIGLHQSRPQTQFTWTNDFDWSEESLDPGAGWGEYVEEYEAALCVSLDIDRGFRWDTRYCQGVTVSGTVCQVTVPSWVREGACRPPEGPHSLRYLPEREVVRAMAGAGSWQLCSIEDAPTPGGPGPSPLPASSGPPLDPSLHQTSSGLSSTGPPLAPSPHQTNKGLSTTGPPLAPSAASHSSGHLEKVTASTSDVDVTASTNDREETGDPPGTTGSSHLTTAELTNADPISASSSATVTHHSTTRLHSKTETPMVDSTQRIPGAVVELTPPVASSGPGQSLVSSNLANSESALKLKEEVDSSEGFTPTETMEFSPRSESNLEEGAATLGGEISKVLNSTKSITTTGATTLPTNTEVLGNISSATVANEEDAIQTSAKPNNSDILAKEPTTVHTEKEPETETDLYDGEEPIDSNEINKVIQAVLEDSDQDATVTGSRQKRNAWPVHRQRKRKGPRIIKRKTEYGKSGYQQSED